MKMSPRETFALRDYLDPELKGRTLSDARQLVSLTEVASQTCLEGRLAELSGASVLLAGAEHAAVPARPRRRSHFNPGCGCRDRHCRHRPPSTMGGVWNRAGRVGPD